MALTVRTFELIHRGDSMARNLITLNCARWLLWQLG